ncbi:MAG: dynamin family protein [Planctomycetes bacterium]|nr:dynamin family protein [Planctomycetota bacterium]
MRTQLGTYCQQFDGTVRPVLQDLDQCLAALDHAADDTPGKALLPALRELGHQLTALCDKVQEQQAYVLIFGPLKSGKSTLMNAIAGAYVSEVSSLPAYPCLVFVRAGKQREYVVTCHDGATRRYGEAAQLHDDIQRAHAQLADAIRAAEQRDVTFDPHEHLPSAIRRVDVHVPDSELKQTGAVLVDTPGLYTRMRFGYDRMTRDFRNAAACAIFVVKSDTLFLEQVFAEFHQLLDLFSRIFLVVNVDSHKRDVGPDGTLVPSLEQSRPEEVLRAFEQLAMSAPLLRASQEGRVRMYPVDLLQAASVALKKSAAQKSAQPNTAADKAPIGFQAFQQDLGDFLASSEYLSAFLRDSLQRAEALLRETSAHVAGGDVVRLERRITDVEARQRWIDQEQQRLTTALGLDWSEAFARGLRDVDAEIERSARDHGAKLLRSLGASIDTWFLSSHSLEWLVQGQWTPLVREYREAVHQAGMRAFEQCTAQANAGLDLPDGVDDLAHRAGVDLRRLRVDALTSLGAIGWPAHAKVPVDVRKIPVKKGVVDHLAFRSLDKVRERLFGAFDKPDVKIPGKDKAKHLGDPGRLHLHQCVAQFRADLLPQTTGLLGEFFHRRFLETASSLLRERLAAYGPRLATERLELDAEHARLTAVAAPLRRLRAECVGMEPKLAALESQFVRDVDAYAAAEQAKDVVLQPQKGPAPRAARAPNATAPSKPQQGNKQPGTRSS